MKSLISLIALVLGLTVMTATPAAARPSVPYGTQHNLDFVANMEGAGPGGQDAALCHYTVRSHLAFLGYWVRSKGYVMSTTGCEGNSFYNIDAQAFVAAQAAGILPADLPATPRLSAQQAMIGFGWLILLGIAGVFKVLQLLMRGRKRATPRSAVAAKMLSAMCIVAKSDGHIDGEEEKAINFAYEKIMGKSLTSMEIRTALAKAPFVTDPRQLEDLGAGTRESDRQTIMRGALLVACSDGEIHDAEHRVIGHLAQALVIPAPQIMSMVRDFAGLLRTPVAAAPA
tara:strand:+ start:929 stop:1783 length:855 start_codon:yes stop_codon:yes gene_type:complete